MLLFYWLYILQLNEYLYNFRLRCFLRLLWICSVYDSSKLPILYPSVVSQRSFVPFCIFPIVIWKYDSPLECSVIFANPWVSIISFVWVLNYRNTLNTFQVHCTDQGFKDMYDLSIWGRAAYCMSHSLWLDGLMIS